MRPGAQTYRGGELVVVVDCSDLDRSAAFWCEVLGYRPAAGAGPEDGGRYRSLVPAHGPGVEVLLQRVPERKAGKNRVHLDLRTADLHAELARVEAAGARRVGGELVEDGWRWQVLADPDGNEFCLLRHGA